MEQALAEYLYGCGHVFYDWGISGKNIYRFVTSYCTTKEEIMHFVRDLSAYPASV
jgi:threonine aldolase